MYNTARYDELSESAVVNIAKDLVAASSIPLVLGILAEGESYGYAIIKRVGDLSGGRLEWTDGMLYPLLHRLERLGHIEAEWGTSESGRKRKYYRITDQGLKELAAHRRQWDAVDSALRDLWRQLSAVIVREFELTARLPKMSKSPVSLFEVY
jgi:DNA-binding PadR family transcriptional regulator